MIETLRIHCGIYVFEFTRFPSCGGVELLGPSTARKLERAASLGELGYLAYLRDDNMKQHNTKKRALIKGLLALTP